MNKGYAQRALLARARRQHPGWCPGDIDGWVQSGRMEDVVVSVPGSALAGQQLVTAWTPNLGALVVVGLGLVYGLGVRRLHRTEAKKAFQPHRSPDRS